MYINHPEELAWVLSIHFQDWFSKPAHHQGPITEADGDWLKLGTDKQTFPHKSAIVKELQVTMEEPPTEEEF